MDLNYIFLVLTGLALVVTVIQIVRNPAFRGSGRKSLRGWIMVMGGVLVASVVLLWLAPSHAGYASFALWLLFGILPGTGFRLIQRLTNRGEYARARQLAGIVRLLHPFIDWAWQDKLLRAHELASQGRIGEARELLAQQETDDEDVVVSRELYLYRLSGDWQGLLDWLDARFDRQNLQESVGIIPNYVRALGEAGDLNAMIQMFRQNRRWIRKTPGLLDACHLFIFAFCGQREQVAGVLKSSSLARSSPELHTFWLATADLASGEEEAGRSQMESLLATGDHLVRRGAQRRLSDGVTLAAAVLTDESWQELIQIERAWSGEKPLTYTVSLSE
jgi:hypothetical protein